MLKLAGGLVGTSVLALGTYYALELDARRRVDGALERIRDRGEPLTYADLVLPKGPPGEDPAEVFARLETLGLADRPFSWAMLDSSMTQTVLDDCSSGVLPFPELCARARELHDCFLAFEASDAANEDPGPSIHGGFESTHPCIAAFHRLRAEDHAPFRSLVEDALPLRRIDLLRGHAAVTGIDVYEPPIAWWLVAVEAFESEAQLASLEGRHGDAIANVGRALRTARTLESAPFYTEFTAWLMGLAFAFAGLDATLLALPSGMDLSGWKAELQSIDPRARLRDAYLGTRVELWRLLQAVDHSDVPLPWLPIDRVYFKLAFVRDQAFALESFEPALERLEHRYWEAPPPEWADEDVLRDIPWFPDRFENLDRLYSSLLIPNFAEAEWIYASAEAQIDLLLACIAAYEGGVEAARAHLTRLPDPFTGRPYGVETLPDGRLRVWSVGRDGVDDRHRHEDRKFDDRDDVVFWTVAP